MTTTSPDLEDLDVRSTIERILGSAVDPDEFTETEMNMIDIAAVHVYRGARAALPSELVDFHRDRDPAGVIRQWAYQWALENPSEIHGWPNGQIIKNVRRSLREKLNEYLHGCRRKALQRPRGRLGRLHEVPGGTDLEAHRSGAVNIAEEKREKAQDKKRGAFTTTRPVKRPQPLKYKGEATRLRGERDAEAIGNLGVIPDPDKLQFALTGKAPSPFDDGRGKYIQRGDKPVFTVPDRFTWENREKFAKLHTRRPTRAEYWGEMFNGNGRRSLRKDLAEDTELHDNTVAAIAEDVVPAVAERFADEARPADHADVARERLRITSEEVQRVLLEKFDVLYEE